ncbi:KilA-N domain-containing protein [Erwinia aphidicola]|uniref:KilA-N domain-containing protein n=1 Tax=Erwinia aphidicola TaxID=68334 RepID=UPI0020A1EDF2|nr:KilA-N domain-containing protein [Erwinia aphidicola]MCP2232858.1 hypothetical protein [Erwinia aphidicola]
MNQLLVIDGVSVRQDTSGRYCLNDLHRAAGGEERHKPRFWLGNQQTQELVQELTEGGNPPLEQNQPVRVIHGGDNRGTYVCKELVYSYAMWISSSFSLKVIRTFDSVVTGQHTSQGPNRADQVQAGVILLESASRTLNLSNSSKLGAYQKLQDFAGLPNMMPSYAIDAPSDSIDGSSRPTMALTTLLQRHNLGISTQEAFSRLQHAGIVERRSRPSTSAKSRNGQKQFWSVTSRGMLFGKNIISPGNPRETQPHFFDTKVQELIRILVSASAS